MTADAPFRSETANRLLAEGRLPSAPSSATFARCDDVELSELMSDGTERLAPIGSMWNSQDLRAAYSDTMAAALSLGAGHDGFGAIVRLLEQMWAADYHFRPEVAE